MNDNNFKLSPIILSLYMPIKDNNPEPFDLVKSKRRFGKIVNVWEYQNKAALIITYVEINGIQVRALWDTGSELTVITNKLAEVLGVPSVRTNYTGTIGGERAHSPVYNVSLSFDQVKMDIEVTGGYSKLSDYFDIIIGLNVIYKGEMVVKLDKGKTVFKFTY